MHFDTRENKKCVQYAVHAKLVRYWQTPWVGEIVKQTCQQWPRKASRLNDKRWIGKKADQKNKIKIKFVQFI